MSRPAVLVAAALSSGTLACGDEPRPDPMVCPSQAPAPPGAQLRGAHAVRQAGSSRQRPPARLSQCGPTPDYTPINRYRGEIASIQDREDAVALINGNCTGTLIAAQSGSVVLTAGHCVALGAESLVVFNHEDEIDGDDLVTNGTVIERAEAPDYALIDLDRLPEAAAVPLTTRSTDQLAIIQHPRGRPKVIAEGAYEADCDGVIYYTDLDTDVASSGASVLNHEGYVVGVHTDGDCADDGSGTNRGATAAAIVAASAYLQDADIADR